MGKLQEFKRPLIVAMEEARRVHQKDGQVWSAGYYHGLKQALQILDQETETIDSMPMDIQQSYQRLQRALSQVGYFRRGTVLKRFMPCGKPGCTCQGSPSRFHGPYTLWKGKVDGKNITVRLTPEQAELVGDWIATGREMDKIIAEMERLSLIATDRLLKELPHLMRSHHEA
jgi:hypothetical protein